MADLDYKKLNDAMWAAVNISWKEEDYYPKPNKLCVPTMEKISEVAIATIRSYLSLTGPEYDELFSEEALSKGLDNA